MVLVNLYGSPCAGKSAGAFYIAGLLKMNGINTELVTEFVKDKIWEESKEAFKNYAYIFGNQYFRLTRCQDKVDVIITDSPILLSSYYNKDRLLGEEFNNMVLKINNSYDSLNYLVQRDGKYNPVGRIHSEKESNLISEDLSKFLRERNQEFVIVKGNAHYYDLIVKDVLTYLETLKIQKEREMVI